MLAVRFPQEGGQARHWVGGGNGPRTVCARATPGVKGQRTEDCVPGARTRALCQRKGDPTAVGATSPGGGG